MASFPVVTTLDQPWTFVVVGYSHLAVVTNRADEAGEWVRAVPRLLHVAPGTTRIVGLSFRVNEHHRPDGSVARRVDSIHIAFTDRVLIYHLASAVDGRHSREVMRFLRDPANLFVGEDVDEGLYLLGAPYHRTIPPTMDLYRVAEIHGVTHLAAGRRHGVPQHVALATALLRTPEGSLRVAGGSDTWDSWPLSFGQVEYAVQSAAVAQILALVTYGGNPDPPAA